jgi:hypothetical protein
MIPSVLVPGLTPPGLTQAAAAGAMAIVTAWYMHHKMATKRGWRGNIIRRKRISVKQNRGTSNEPTG